MGGKEGYKVYLRTEVYIGMNANRRPAEGCLTRVTVDHAHVFVYDYAGGGFAGFLHFEAGVVEAEGRVLLAEEPREDALPPLIEVFRLTATIHEDIFLP